MKHEQAMNDSKNKPDTLWVARRANRFMNRDDVDCAISEKCN